MATDSIAKTNSLPSINPAAAELIADKIQSALNNARVLGLAIKGQNTDGSEELCHVLYRGVEDDLYNLLRDLTGDHEEGEGPRWIELQREEA